MFVYLEDFCSRQAAKYAEGSWIVLVAGFAPLREDNPATSSLHEAAKWETAGNVALLGIRSALPGHIREKQSTRRREEREATSVCYTKPLHKNPLTKSEIGKSPIISLTYSRLRVSKYGLLGLSVSEIVCAMRTNNCRHAGRAHSARYLMFAYPQDRHD